MCLGVYVLRCLGGYALRCRFLDSSIYYVKLRFLDSSIRPFLVSSMLPLIRAHQIPQSPLLPFPTLGYLVLTQSLATFGVLEWSKGE